VRAHAKDRTNRSTQPAKEALKEIFKMRCFVSFSFLFLVLAWAVAAEQPFVEVKRPLGRTFLEADDKIFLGEKFSSGFVHIPPRGEMFYWYFPSRRDAANVRTYAYTFSRR
jgi:hypothetical protein